MQDRESRAYMALKEACADRGSALQRLRANGKKTVWMLGDDVPEEAILAAGMQPIRLIGEYGARPNADRYLEKSFGPLWQAYFEKIVSSARQGLIDYLVLSNSSDIIQRMYYYLMQLDRIDESFCLPPTHYVDYSLMVKDFSAQERNVRETREFIGKLEKWSGRAISREDLVNASALCNDHRKALRRLGRLRCQNKLLGSEALVAVIGSFFYDKPTAAALLNVFADDAEGWPVLDCIPAVYTGSLQETPELYELLEGCGINIVADDKLTGCRYSDRDVELNTEPAIAISQRYHLRFPSSERGFVAERAECIPALAESSGAKALVIFLNRNDESYIWDYPKQKKRLDELGIPAILVEKQEYPLRCRDDLVRTFTSFAASVKEAAGNG